MNRSTLILLLASMAVLAALNIYQYVDRQSLREKLGASMTEGESHPIKQGRLVAGKSSVSPGGQPTKSSNRRIRESAPSGSSGGESPGTEGFQEIAQKWAEMMDNPAMKKQMLAQMDAQMGPVLADLFAHLELEGQDLTHFKGLLAEQWMAQQQVGMKMMSAGGDPEKNAAIKEELKKTREATEERVREFLNSEEDYAYFQAYQKQMPDRMELEQFASSLEAEGLTLAKGQKEQLLTAMGEERVASMLGDVSNPEGWDFEKFNEETITEVMAKTSDFHQRVQVRAGTLLDQKQLEVLTASQEQQRNMQEMGMKMGLQMMKNMRKQE